MVWRALLRSLEKRHVPFPKSDTTTTQQRPFDRHTYTHDFEPDPRWYPPKKGQRNTASLHLNFLADCQHFAQLAAVFGLLFVFPISRTLASVSTVCLVVSFWLFFFQLLSFNSSAAQEHKCAPRQGWQHKSQNARRAKHKIPPPRSCSSPCLLYFDFLLFFPLSSFLNSLRPRGCRARFCLFPISNHAQDTLAGYPRLVIMHSSVHPIEATVRAFLITTFPLKSFPTCVLHERDERIPCITVMHSKDHHVVHFPHSRRWANYEKDLYIP